MAKSADAFRTISEVADWLGVQTHVLRFWESKFSQVKPVKRAGGRRYYRPADMLLLGGIRKLLHDDGLTIKGVQKILREEGMAHVADLSQPLDEVTAGQIEGEAIAIDDQVEAEMASDVEEPRESAEVTPLVRPDGTPPVPRVETSFVPPAEVHEDEDEDGEDRAPDADPSEAAGAADADDDTAAAASGPAPDTASPLPSFLRPAPEPQPDADTEAEAEVEASAPDAPPAGDAAGAADRDKGFGPSGLPSFLAQPESPAEPAGDADTAPAEDAPADRADTPAPRPQDVDVPPDPEPGSFDAAPSLLTKAAMARRLSPKQRAALAPLVADLAALRDRMAGTRGEPRQ